MASSEYPIFVLSHFLAHLARYRRPFLLTCFACSPPEPVPCPGFQFRGVSSGKARQVSIQAGYEIVNVQLRRKKTAAAFFKD